MDITVNGTARSAPDGARLPELVEDLGLTGRRIAVSVNGTVVPRSTWPEHALAPGDRVEVVHAIGGG